MHDGHIRVSDKVGVGGVRVGLCQQHHSVLRFNDSMGNAMPCKNAGQVAADVAEWAVKIDDENLSQVRSYTRGCKGLHWLAASKHAVTRILTMALGWPIASVGA